MKKVLIVGAGFAGLNAAKTLGNQKDIEVTLIDRRNHHLFQPLLYQGAMAGLSPADIAAPIRSILSKYRNIRVFQAEITDINLQKKYATSELGDHYYDYLILACGAQHSYFGNEQWEAFAPGLKTLEQATEIRRRVLTAFELAERETDPVSQKKHQTFVIVGGGPTGVELAGAIGEMSRFTLAKDFKNIDPKLTRIILIEAGPRILASFSKKLSGRAMRDLETLGVQIWTSSLVTNIDKEGVEIKEEHLQAATVIWAAGVQASKLGATLSVESDRQQRIKVQPDLSLKEFQEVFVIGDQAHICDKNGNPLPGLAPVALQEGIFAGKNICRDVKGQPRQDFKYLDKGQMATIGKRKAIVETTGFKFGGFFAWITWLLIHIYYLTGFTNRAFVTMSWAWSYLTFRRGARLIVSKEWRSYPPKNTSQKSGL